MAKTMMVAMSKNAPMYPSRRFCGVVRKPVLRRGWKVLGSYDSRELKALNIGKIVECVAVSVGEWGG